MTKLEAGLVVAALPFLDGHVLLHSAGQPQGSKGLHHQGNAGQPGQNFFTWLGVQFEQ
jgi:hypothetical protein